MEADSEPKTRRGGMNINNILCWKIVTMDIIEGRQWKLKLCTVSVGANELPFLNDCTGKKQHI